MTNDTPASAEPDTKFVRANRHDSLPIILVGVAVFVASFAMFQYLVPSTLLMSSAAAAIMAMMAIALATAAVARRLYVRNARMALALNNMSQGLCMFDKNERLVICNKRYIEIYRLSAEASAPGVTIAEMLKYRAANGTFLPDPDKYRRELVDAMAQGKILTSEVKSADGRLISVINRAMPHGGWVGSHEDI